jgi:hypothetical protein
MLILGLLIGVILGAGATILLSILRSPGKLVVWEDLYGDPPTLTLELSQTIHSVQNRKRVALVVENRNPFSQK